MIKYLLSLLILAILFNPSTATLGIDTAGAFQLSTFQCLKNAGFQYAIIRALHSYGSIDKTAIQSLTNAKQAGLSTDVYIFPCRGKNASAQVDEMFSGISASLYNEIWVDVQTNPSSGCSWSGHDAASNCAFLTQTINRIKSHSKSAGIYSSANMWQTIFGSKTACPGVASVPLWYAHYDNNPSFSDFSAFGGWTKPSIKQFAGDLTVCGIDLDKNYKP